MNSRSSSAMPNCTHVGRPWLQLPLRSVSSILRSNAFISGTVSARLARTAACHRGQQLIAAFGEHTARAELAHLGEDRAQQSLRIQVREQYGHRANDQLAGTGGGHVE